MKKLTLLISLLLLLAQCSLIRNSFKYDDITQDFIEALFNEDYDHCMELTQFEPSVAATLDTTAYQASLKDFRNRIITHFGTELNFSLMEANKKWSTNPEENTPANSTLAHIQYCNNTDVGVFEVLFADQSNKIQSIKILDVKEPIPNMIPFWLFGILALCIPAFNIYVIRLVKKSDTRRKWLKYIAVCLFNVPAITYASTGGINFEAFNFQILLGISFNYLGYLNSYWTFGIPLGGLYWLWKIKTNRIKPTDEQKVKDD